MKAQELLTYVEELVFKTSMFGYDKDEVDNQLDKICDEIEEIVKEKDKEIEALKKGQTIYVSREAAPEQEGAQEEAEGKTEIWMPEDGDGTEQELREQIAQLTRKLQEAEANAARAEKLAEEAEDRAATAEKKAAAAEGRAAVARTKAMAEAAAAAKEAEEEVPKTRDEAYEHYMRNADLLCAQLSDIQGKQDSIIKEAEEKAAKTVREAEKQAAGAVKEAEEKAAKILEEAQAQANGILEGIQDRRAEEQKKYDALLEQKQTMLASLKELVEKAGSLLEESK